MSWKDYITLHVDIALGHGVLEAESPALKLAIGTGTASVSDARIGYGAIGSTQTAGYFTVGDATYGKIGVAGRIPGDTWDEAAYTPLESFARQLTIRRSKAGRFSSFDTGTCSIVFRDESRDLDPLNLDGPYVVSGTTLLTRGRRVRVYADWMGARRYLFSGFVDSWPSQLDMYEAAFRSVECVDWFGLLALFDGYEQAPAGAGETVTARIHRILDAADIPYADRDIGSSSVTCAATTLAGNILSLLRQAAATDGGQIWVSPDGRITFRSRNEIWTGNAANRVVWSTVNDGSLLTSSTTCLYAGTPQVAESDAYSAFFLARDGADTIPIVDTELKDKIGWASYERGDLIADSDAQVSALGYFLVASQPSDNQYQVTGVVVRPDIHAEARSLALTHTPFDRMSVQYEYPVSGLSGVEREALITGVEHQITAGGNGQPPIWQTRLSLEDVTGFGAFTIGRSAIGSDDFIP